MYKSLEIQISPRHKLYKTFDTICFKSKNLYNATNYIIRQHLFTTGKHITSKELYDKIKITEAYNDFGHLQISNQILRDIIDSWSCYKASIKSYKKDPSIWSGRPKFPKYKHKEKGRFQTCFIAVGTSPPVKQRNGWLKFMGKSKFKLEIPEYIKGKTIKEVVIVPTLQHYSVLINYVEEKEKLVLNPENVAAIDLGINNLMTVTFNNGYNPILFKGGIVKSINQYYNKKLAEYQSKLPQGVHTSRKIKILTRKRNNKIRYELHCQSKQLSNLLHERNIGQLVIGKSKEWKQNISIGKINNQKFVQIPYNTLINQIQYKYDGNIILQEESFTSKASFLDNDNIPIYSKKMETSPVFSGKRICRGLYQTSTGRKINADVNGSYNIMKKSNVIPNLMDGIEAIETQPVIFKV